MSRYFDDYDGDSFPNQAALWEANYERALKGKRGRKVLTDLREALMALPEHKLIEGALCTVGAGAEINQMEARSTELAKGPDPGVAEYDRWAASDLHDAVDGQGEGVCAIGAYLWHKAVKDGATPDEAFAGLPRLLDTDHDISETADAARAAGVAWVLAWRLAYMNDEWFRSKTPEQRHAAFIEWIDKQLAESAA